MVLLLGLNIIFMTAAHFIFDSVFSFCTKILVINLLMVNFGAVPIIDFIASAFY